MGVNRIDMEQNARSYAHEGLGDATRAEQLKNRRT